MKRVFNIDVIFGACLEERHVTVLLTELLALEAADLLFFHQIHLVTNDKEREVFDVLRL